ncbi:protein of unknown function [Pedobacter suwonensis]|uniref:DUF4393 domain-containing protein n=1 Tax=Pedobacter suwonensis TaxID=332999 RepID=A0A1I0TSN8_9SPHI|nr:DUF4393 domain-containing protein [Pedobacter suwonensis]SFA54841.1 protein of unknown function [Pedobacter suwonensis]
MMDVEKLGNIIGAETLKKIYEDSASESLKETSKLGVDIIKTLRLFTLPLQLAATAQDRLTAYLDRVRKNVPKEKQVQAPASLAGPIIERLKYLEEENYLTDLYLNLLSRAIDKERINEAHPAFFYLIDQLSPDEAYFLFKINYKEIKLTREHNFNEVGWPCDHRITKNDFNLSELDFPENFEMYVSHLEKLGLIDWTVVDSEYPVNSDQVQTGLIRKGKIHLTEFGKLFAKACIPEKGFLMSKSKS